MARSARPAMELKIVSLERTYGPLPFETLLRLAAEGRLSALDQVRLPGTAEWMPVSEVPALAAALQQPPEVVADDEPGGWAMTLPRRKADEIEMDMTPMIDVTFQLLIFFMLTNALANPAPMDTPEAVYGRGVTLDGQQLILIDERGAYYLGDAPTSDSRAASLEALIDEVGQNAKRSEMPLEVIISAHRQSKHGQVRELVERLGTLDDIGKVMLGVEEKKQW